ncbi:MAG: metallophosphoesterase [Candidatus Ozemobacteraceae bacterium]
MISQRAVRIAVLMFLITVFAITAGWCQSATPFQDEQIAPAVGITVPSAGNAEARNLLASLPLTIDAGPFLLAVMSDLHVCQENLASLRRTVATVNGLPNVGVVALLGDLCKTVGSSPEYALAGSLVKQFKPQVLAIIGNHDFLYTDELGKNGKKKRGTPAGKTAKLKKFRAAFGQKAIRFTRIEAGHLLVFLPVDALDGKSITTLSETTLEYLKGILEKYPSLPTIVFCHGPLENSYTESPDPELTMFQSTAQPAGRIRAILKQNPQVFLWVAGHRHIRPSSDSFDAPVNKIDNVTVIHVPNVPDDRSWIMTIRMTPREALVRTLDGKTGNSLSRFDRRFTHSKGSDTAMPTNGKPSENTLEKSIDTVKDTVKDQSKTFVEFFNKLWQKVCELFRNIFSR